MTDGDRFDLVLRLTLLSVAFYGPPSWYVALPSVALVVPMLANPRWLRSQVGWLLLVVVLAQGVVTDWFFVDNHQFLIVYWLLAINLSLHSQDGPGHLAAAGKALIGGTFLAAATWKFLGGEFLDGTFWEATILTDERLAVPSRLLGLTAEQVQENHEFLAQFTRPEASASMVSLSSTERIDSVATVMGWFGAASEAAVSLLYLTPRALLPDSIRLGSLLFFIFTVYFWLPVVGFAWILLVMALASLDQPSHRLVYFVLFVAVGMVLVETPKEFSLALFL